LCLRPTLYYVRPGQGGNRLSGSLPFELALLPNLTVVLLDDNEIRGSIPESWSTMSNLERLELRGNGLTGTFPESILLNNPKLETIILGSNSFTGTIPTLIGSVPLIDLRLEGNRFNGTIPTEIASISSLRKFCSTFFLCFSLLLFIFSLMPMPILVKLYALYQQNF
jgi:Leucine-rich repeat (LRR) protein